MSNLIKYKLYLLFKDWLFPGLDLHTRCRYRFLDEFILEGSVNTLDAGFGNGALAYLAYQKGSRVLGVSYLQREVTATQDYFDWKAVPRERMQFCRMNIYHLRDLNQQFDQIICTETLEHITHDAEVIRIFAELLRPGGRLILSCPYALHPDNALGRENEPEDGRHVRDGYTLESYKALLEPAGFQIVATLGLGSPLLCFLEHRLRVLRARSGDAGALPAFLAMLPLTRLDYINPEPPLSLVVIAEKQCPPG